VANATAIPEDEKRHALLWAIAEFREDLRRLFDEHVALATGRAHETVNAPEAVASVVIETPASQTLSIATPPANGAHASPVAPLGANAVVASLSARDSDTGIRPNAAPVWTRPREAAPAGANAPAAHVAHSSPAHIEAPASRSDDPRQRLDALAKLLDRRVKQTGASPGESSAKPEEG
jgi:hypothetical protein